MSKVSTLAINAADHLVSKGRLDAAASILKNFLATNAPQPIILQRLGRILLTQGRGAEAIPIFEKALKLSQRTDGQPANAGDDGAGYAEKYGRKVAATELPSLDAEAS